MAPTENCCTVDSVPENPLLVADRVIEQPEVETAEGFAELLNLGYSDHYLALLEQESGKAGNPT